MIPSFGADLGFVSDSSALVGVMPLEKGRFEVVSIDELRPRKGHPLKPKEVIDTFAERILSFGGSSFASDPHYRESAKEHLAPHGIQFVDAPGGADGKLQTYLLARKLIHEQRVRLPNHPRLLAQLRSVVSRDLPGGGTKISIPRRRGAGHGDICSALVVAIWRAQRSQKKAAGPYVWRAPAAPVDTSPVAGFIRLGAHRE